MENISHHPMNIAKEQVVGLQFPDEDVLILPERKKERRSRLEYAVELGNSAFYKVKILFEDSEGMKKVKTTLWGLTKESVVLKHNTKIPIRRIHEIYLK